MAITKLEQIFDVVRSKGKKRLVAAFANDAHTIGAVSMAGFGLRQPLGERSSLSILILWSIDPPKISPYSNPVIRVGFNF